MALNEEIIEKYLTHEYSFLEVYESVDSTNNIIREKKFSNMVGAVVADHQSAGRGRRGRSFESPKGSGLYMSLGVKPDFMINEAVFVTMTAAVAVSRAIEQCCGVSAGIKWVNDLFVNGRKVSGILTEAFVTEGALPESLIIGNGINCYGSEFSKEVSNIAGCVSDKPFSREMLAAYIINEMNALLKEVPQVEFLDEYRSRCFILGKNITVHADYKADGYSATALQIAEDGGLVVRVNEGEKNGSIVTLYTGEVSIRI